MILPKLVIFDGDETLWTCKGVGYASLLHLPLKRISIDKISDSYGNELILFDSSRKCLEILKNNNIYISLVTHNDVPQVQSVLKLLEIEDFFSYPVISWQDKEKSISEILNEFGSKKIYFKPEYIYFVDDSSFNFNGVREKGIQCVHMGQTISKPIEIIKKMGLGEGSRPPYV